MTYNHFLFRKHEILHEVSKLLRGLWPMDDPSRLIGIRLNNIRSQVKHQPKIVAEPVKAPS